jgi:hypothetical protein
MKTTVGYGRGRVPRETLERVRRIEHQLPLIILESKIFVRAMG